MPRPTPRAFEILLLVLVMLVWASASTVTKAALSQVPPLLFALLRFAVASAVLIPLVLVELQGIALPVLTAQDWLGIMYLGVVSTSGGYLLYNLSLAHLDASQAATFINLLPVFGVAIAVIFLGEAVAAWQLAGGALVLFGVWLAA